MKKLILPAIIILAASFSGKNYFTTNAEANQVQGVYIFTDSKPVQDYEYLGTVKNGMVQAPTDITGRPVLGTVCDPTYNQLRDDLIKRAKKKYKDFSGIIINPDNNTADVIKFKD